jgi:AbiV family abortive infection protein
MPTSVSPRYLLEGAVYALEQCGLLLRDANVLYRNGSYSSAVAVALFAQEELGRWSILLDLRRKVLDGDNVTVKDIQASCGNHVRKQEAGMMSFTMRVVTDPGGLLDTYLNVRQGSEEWNTAREQLEQARQTVPVGRHKQRMSALYVDAVSAGRWRRPTREISLITAYVYLQGAANDYSGQWDRCANPSVHKPDDPELYTALENWPARPILLPRPERPSLPPWLDFKPPA